MAMILALDIGMAMVVKWWECVGAMGVCWRNEDSFWCSIVVSCANTLRPNMDTKRRDRRMTSEAKQDPELKS